MKRLIIIGEGQTEQEFCKDVLYPHFFEKGILVENPTIKHSNGGMVSWSILKSEIEMHLINNDVRVTLLIDLYGIKDSHNFPSWLDSKKIVGKNERMLFLENAMVKDISEDKRYRFIPYIQLHEFEALLFSDKDVFDANFEKSEFLDYEYLQDTLKIVNPEEINDSPHTSPSKRLEKIIKGYKSETDSLKVFYGSLLAQEIGLQKIREKCNRFDRWISILEKI